MCYPSLFNDTEAPIATYFKLKNNYFLSNLYLILYLYESYYVFFML